MHRRQRRGDRGICSTELPYILVMKKMWMYLTILVTLVTSESTFSALRLLKDYLRSTMNQDCLNDCLLMHCHKLATGRLYTVKVAKRFACANEKRKGHFGKFVQGYICKWLSGREVAHVSKHSTASDMSRSKLLLPWTTRLKYSLGGTYVHKEVA